MPLRKLDGDAFRPVDENQLAGVKVHDLVARAKAVRLQLADLGLDVIDRKADMVHAELVEVANVRIGQRLRMLISQQLYLRSRRGMLQNERHVVGLDPWNSHVAGE